MLWLMLACSGPSPDDTDDLPPTDVVGDDDDDTVPVGDDDDDDDTVPDDTGDTGAPDPCEAAPTLTVVGVTTDQPWQPNELEVTVSLSEAASAAVACTLRSDPAEVHLVEGTTAATEHVLRMPGLLGGEAYDCVAAAVCPASTATATPFEVTTNVLPAVLPRLNAITYDPAAGSEYLLLNHSDDCTWDRQQLLVADRQGRVRWWMGTPQWVGPSVEFRYHGDDLFAWGGGWNPNNQGRPRLVNLYDGETYDSAVALADVNQSGFHHDGKRLPDGRLLTLEEVDVENGPVDFLGFRVRRVDPVTDTVDFDYHSQRGFNQGHLPAGFGDAWHANWVDIVDVGGDETLLVSLCNLGWTVAIDVASGDVRWVFGSGGDWSLQDGAGGPLGNSEFPQCEHGLEFAGDQLLVYDNGLGRGYSRASQYTLDETSMVATLEWTWTEPDWYESTLGDVDWMDSGHVLVNMGHANCFSSNPGDHTTVVEIDPVSGTKLWEAQYPQVDQMAYRADWADPCALFANALYCTDVADRLVELEGPLTP